MEKKKFKIPIRKELLTYLLTMVAMFGIMFAFMPLFGSANGMIAALGILTIVMVTKSDYSLHMKKNTAFFFIVQLSLVALAFAASLSLATKIPVSFAVFFLIIYIFTYDDKMSIYMPFLLNFIMMVNFPVYGTDLGIRFAIIAVETVIMMGLQLLIHRNKFKKKTKKQMEELVPMMEKQIKAIKDREEQEAILKINQDIAASLTTLQGSLDAKLGLFATKWDDGNRYLKGVLLFKRINRFLNDTYCSPQGNQETYSSDILDSLTILLHTIVKYEEKQIDQKTVEQALYGFSQQVRSTTFSYELETDIQLFKKQRIDEQELIKPTTSLWETFKSRINTNNLIYALKVSLICVAGMLVSELLHLPKSYIFPLSVIIVTQPYTKLTRKAASGRMLNTVYMVAIYLLAFSFTSVIWQNILILVVIILVGDIFLKFNFSVVISGIMSVAMGTIASSAEALSGTEYAFLRLAYVCAACIIIVLIDSLVFPRHVNVSVDKQIKKSVYLNQHMLSLLANPNTTTDDFKNALRQKRGMNRKLKFNQQYIKLDDLDQYLLSDQEWTERIYFIYDSLLGRKLAMEQVSNAFQIVKHGTQNMALVAKTETDVTLRYMIINLYDIINGMQTSENIMTDKIQPILQKHI